MKLLRKCNTKRGKFHLSVCVWVCVWNRIANDFWNCVRENFAAKRYNSQLLRPPPPPARAHRSSRAHAHTHTQRVMRIYFVRFLINFLASHRNIDGPAIILVSVLTKSFADLARHCMHWVVAPTFMASLPHLLHSLSLSLIHTLFPSLSLSLPHCAGLAVIACCCTIWKVVVIYLSPVWRTRDGRTEGL